MLIKINEKQYGKRNCQHDHRQRRGPGVVVLIELGDDQQRSDLSAHGEIARDEHHRTVLAGAAGEG